MKRGFLFFLLIFCFVVNVYGTELDVGVPHSSTILNDSSRAFSSSGGAETETLTIDGAVMETSTATARNYTSTTYTFKDASGNTIAYFDGSTWTLTSTSVSGPLTVSSGVGVTGDVTLSGNITDGSNPSSPANIKDAVDKKHSQNTDTGTTADTFVIDSDGTPYTLVGADLSDAVTKKHSQNTDTGTTNDTFTLDSDGNAYTLTIAATGMSTSGPLTVTALEAAGDVTTGGNLTDGTNASSPANIKDAVDKKHAQNTDTTLTVGDTSIVLADSGSGELTITVDGGTILHYTATGGWDFYTTVNFTAPAAVTSGYSTITQSTTTLTFAVAADAAAAYTGATVTANASSYTAHVIAVTGALTRTVAESQTIVAGTAIQQIQGPSAVIQDASGNELNVFYADGAQAHISAAGVGLGFETVDGNRGIGTTAPGAKLDIGGGDISLDEGKKLTINIAGGDYRAIGGSGADLYIGQGASGWNNIIFAPGAEVMRINSASNVGVMTATPDGTLDVHGTTIINPAAADGYGYTFAAASVVWELTPVTGSLRADNTAWQLTPTYAVDVAALAPVAAYIGNDGTLGFSSSTLEAKKNVVDIPANVTVDDMRVIKYEPKKRNIITEIVQVPYQEVETVTGEAGEYTRTVTKYREEVHKRVDGYKDEGAGYTRYGLIAEEMAKTHPELVYAGGKGVDYEQIIPLLIKEIQALKARVHKLEEINVADRRGTL